jgi:RNA 3'-terminal phosphate cyclase
MAIMEIISPDPDWLFIRQSLSLALLKQQPITIGGAAAFLDDPNEYRPLFEDTTRAAGIIGAGRIFIEDRSIRFDPQPLAAGRTHFETGAHSSAVELLLFLMPALFHCDFRSILEFSGVTHSPLSAPTAFVKETLMGAIERLGFYGSLTLKRFGFYGSGGGAMEARTYPREAAAGTAFTGRGGAPLSGAKIFISRLDTGLAELEKNMIAERLEIDRNRIAIIEVMDSDGPGNGIQVFAEQDGIPVVISHEMRLFSGTGEIILTEDALNSEIDHMAGEVRALSDGALPERLVRELYPYYVMSGKVPAGWGESPRITMTRRLCEQIL